MYFPKVFVIGILVIISQGQIIAPSVSSLASSYIYQNLNQQTCCSDQTITVYGSSTIQAPPDTAILNVQITVSSDTVSNAIATLSAQVNTIISILNSNGLSSSNYQTSSLNVYPNTSYTDGVSTVLGQIASQSLDIKIPVLSSNGSNIGKLIDSLASVNGIILNGLSFDIVNKTDELALVRSNAFSNAQKKALDYATSLQLSLGQLVTIKDSYSSAPVVISSQTPILSANAAAAPIPTTINVGSISISYNLEAIYAYG